MSTLKVYQEYKVPWKNMFFYGIKKQCTVLGIIWMERLRKQIQLGQK